MTYGDAPKGKKPAKAKKANAHRNLETLMLYIWSTPMSEAVRNYSLPGSGGFTLSVKYVLLIISRSTLWPYK